MCGGGGCKIWWKWGWESRQRASAHSGWDGHRGLRRPLAERRRAPPASRPALACTVPQRARAPAAPAPRAARRSSPRAGAPSPHALPPPSPYSNASGIPSGGRVGGAGLPIHTSSALSSWSFCSTPARPAHLDQPWTGAPFPLPTSSMRAADGGSGLHRRPRFRAGRVACIRIPSAPESKKKGGRNLEWLGNRRNRRH
jgi:hypothetical protein